jgi:hypothetical protein
MLLMMGKLPITSDIFLFPSGTSVYQICYAILPWLQVPEPSTCCVLNMEGRLLTYLSKFVWTAAFKEKEQRQAELLEAQVYIDAHA